MRNDIGDRSLSRRASCARRPRQSRDQVVHLGIDVSDDLVPDLSRALAKDMDVPEPATPAARVELARAWIKEQVKVALLDYRGQ